MSAVCEQPVSHILGLGILLQAQGGVPCAVRKVATSGSSVSSEDRKDVIEWLLQWTGLQGAEFRSQMFEFLSFELIVHDSAGGWFPGLLPG